MVSDHLLITQAAQAGLGTTPLVGASPRPGVAKPECRQQVQRGGFGAPIGRRDANQDVIGPGLGILGENVPIAILFEDTGIAVLSSSRLGFFRPNIGRKAIILGLPLSDRARLTTETF